MIRLRREGEELCHGINIMVRPHFQLFVMLATYRHRVVFGIGYTRYGRKFYNVFRRWTLDDDYKNILLIHGYHKS